MAERIAVSGPDLMEESRQLAEVLADLHHVCQVIVENATFLVPGEAVEKLQAAWAVSERSLRALVSERLLMEHDANVRGSAKGAAKKIAGGPATPPELPPQLRELEEGELTGEVGALKRGGLRRGIEAFFMWWYSEPRSPEKIKKATQAAADVMEVAASVVSSIPHQEKVVEIISLFKQLLGIRLRRGF
jgi:hypothetical protein